MDEEHQRGRVAAQESQRRRAVLDAHLARIRKEDPSGFQCEGLAMFGVARIFGIYPRVHLSGQWLPWPEVKARGGWPTDNQR